MLRIFSFDYLPGEEINIENTFKTLHYHNYFIHNAKTKSCKIIRTEMLAATRKHVAVQSGAWTISPAKWHQFQG